MLTTQYQMHPEICSLANSHFYEGKISNAKSNYLDVENSRFEHYMFVNVDLERAPNVRQIIQYNSFIGCKFI